MAENSDSPEIVWKNAKLFMGWKSSGTPHQLKVDNQLVTSAKKIAQLMNEFLSTGRCFYIYPGLSVGLQHKIYTDSDKSLIRSDHFSYH